MAFVMNNDGTKGKVINCVFAYVKLQSGAYKYQSTTELEYCVDCIVSRDTAKAFKKAFPKNGYKEVETSDFENIYKIKPPFDGDEQYIIKLKSNANLKADVPKAGLVTGDIIPYEWNSRPKAFINVDGGVEDITMTTLISNGSKGDVAFRVNENSYGKFPQLTGILVTDLIEYISEKEDSDFGKVVGGLNPGDGNVKQIPTQTEVEDEVNTEYPDDDLDIPF